MKKIYMLLSLLIICVSSLFAQAPEKFTYQAVVRNASNQLVINAQVGVRVNILQGSASGNAVYSESHVTSSNANGLVTVNIGGGSVLHGSFEGIDWSDGPYFLKTDIDPNGGNDYSITSTQQLLSVPYALYAKEAANSFSGDYNDLTNAPAIPTVPTNVSAFTNDAGYITAGQVPAQVNADWNATTGAAEIFNKPAIPTVPTNVSAFTNDAGYITGYTETDPQFAAWDKDYNDLINKPAIPAVPTNVSAFTNDAGYITSAAIPAIPTVPTNVSAFTNDAGYITAAQCGDVDICAMANQLAQLQQQMSQMQARLDSLEGNTTFTCGTSTVTDHEGNVYHTVKIGDQCWMRDNLRTTTSPSTGTYLIPAAGTDATFTGKQARWYNNDSTTYAPMNYGLLYNWNAAVDTFNTAYGETSVNSNSSNAVSVTFTGHRRGICPAGWHLPSYAEWTQLTNYVSSQSEYTCDSNSNYIAKALASTEGWNTYTGNCAVGNDPSTNNATGFSAVPAGFCDGSSVGNAGGCAYFWSSAQGYSSDALSLCLFYYIADVGMGSYGKYSGRSVRCLRDSGGGDGSSATLPTVTTNTISNITPTTATCGGNIIADGGASVTARGVCWSTSQNPTISNSHTTNGSGTGSYSSSISGLTANTTYYVRAYATNSVGTAYGEEVTFTTLSAGGTAVIDSKSCPGTPTVTDHEGNVYATVQIGDQCWMRDNLRTTTSPSTGTYLIPASSTGYTYTGKQARWYNNDSATYAPMNYGLLYNWNAAVDTFNTTYGETSVNTSSSNAVSVTFNGHRRGICPVGWHLPSDAEWTTLTDYVSSQSEFQCGGNSNYIAKALASAEGWNTYTNNCVVGNDPSTNNATGFSAVPAGICNGSSFDYAGYDAGFRSSTQDHSDGAYSRGLNYGFADVYGGNGDKSYAYSVRCLRD